MSQILGIARAFERGLERVLSARSTKELEVFEETAQCAPNGLAELPKVFGARIE
jgi:hypothetical protein